MAAWKNFSASLQGSLAQATQGLKQVDLSGVSSSLTQAGGNFQNSFSTVSQQFRESTGRADRADITELPEDYIALERRVDALRQAHLDFLKIAKVYDTETYDYPTQVNESLQELSQNVGHSISFWASAATKGTNLPQPSVLEKAPEQHKTLSHALSRAAANGAVEIGGEEPLARALKSYSVAQDSIGNARLDQDEIISREFLAPWSANTHSQIAAAMKARANVKSSRLALDAARSRNKAIMTGPKVEQARLEVEQAEEKLVNATEEAINLMRACLESPTPLSALANLVKAQSAYHARSAEILAGIVGEMEDASAKAEGEFRKSRA